MYFKQTDNEYKSEYVFTSNEGLGRNNVQIPEKGKYKQITFLTDMSIDSFAWMTWPKNFVRGHILRDIAHVLS